MALPAGYESGPDATVRATAAARRHLDDARGVILVEGVSDQIAVDAAADVMAIATDGLVVMPIGGAHAIARMLDDLARRVPPAVPVSVLCDAGESSFVVRAIEASPRRGVARFVCDADLEDELIRAAGPDLLAHLIDLQGDRPSFARMSVQPAWRDAPYDARFRRFVGAGAGRKHRYAAAIVSALDVGRLPTPLVAAIRHVTV